MTQNIHIRFLGSADLGQVRKEVSGVTKDVAALSAAVQAAATDGGRKQIANVQWLESFKKDVAAQRSLLHSSINALDEFGVKSIKVADHVDTLTERIRAQKFGIRDLIQEHKSLRDVYRQQMANRQAMVMEWSRNGDGTINADVITRNRNAAEFNSNIRNWRSELGMYNQVLASVADNTVKWGKNTQWAGRQMTAGLSMPLLAAAAGTGALAYEIDKGLTQIIKVYGDAETALTTSDEQIRESSMATVRALASNYGQSAKDSLEITAQLAATGRVGMELQQSAAEVSRARLLGELDLQDAMKATTTLQSVYNMSSKELADTFNYMNSMENQTVLTMQDFVVGIPKVTGVIKELGGDIRETGTLLAAMKIAGIDAAEGANAIKSIAFKTAAQNNGAKGMFESLVGQSYESVVGETTDVTERLVLIGQAMKEAQLTATQRVGLIAKMFGLYQGSKALSIIGQLTDGSEQMTRALEVADQSTEEWGATAARELEKLTGSNWNKLQQQWQSLKISLAEVGDVFLEMGVPVLEFVNGLVDKFNGLDDGTKKWIARLTVLAAAFGPIVMFAGLMGNMIGSIGKLSSFLVNIIAPFKMLTDEQIVADKISRMKRKSTSDEAVAYGVLAEQIGHATFELKRLAMMQQETLGLVVPGYTEQMVRQREATRDPKTGMIVTAAAATDDIEKNANKTKGHWNKITANVGTFALLGTTAMASMASDSGTLLGTMSDIAFIAAGLGPLLVNLPWGKVGARAKTAFSGVTDFFTGEGRAGTKAMTSVRTRASGMATAFRSILPAIGGVSMAVAGIGVAAAAAYYVVNKSQEQSRKEMEAFQNSAKGYANALGFAYTETSSKIDAAGKSVETLETKVVKFKEANADAVKVMQQFAGSPDELLNRAVNEGVKASLHGATAEQAREAAMIAARAMGSKLQETELKAKIDAVIDFGNTDQVMQRRLNDISAQISKAAKNGFEKGWADTVFNGDDELTKNNAQAIQSNVKELMGIYNAASEEERPKIMDQIRNMALDGDRALFNEIRKNHEAEFKKQGIMNVQQALEAAKNVRNAVDPNIRDAQGTIIGQKDIQLLNTSNDEWDKLNLRMDTNKAIVETLKANTSNLTEEQMRNIDTVQEWEAAVTEQGSAQMTAIEAGRQWMEWQNRMEKSGAKWSEREKLTRLNILRRAAGMRDATHSEQGFADAVEKSAGALRNLFSAAQKNPGKIQTLVGMTGVGYNSNIAYTDATQATDALKETYSNAMNTIYSEAARSSDLMLQKSSEATSRHFDNLREGLDKQQKAASDSFDKQVRRFDYAWEDKMDAFAKKWEKRKEATAAKYDTQIDKIKAAIEAEEEAERIRERIFEAEKTRLSRLAEMQNRGIDFNSAMRTGNMDEAAKISNDMAATSTSWILEDAAAAGGDASAARRAALEGKIDTLEKQKDAALKRMDEQEEREKKMLERQKDRERDLLDARRRAMEETFAIRKRNLDRQEAAERAQTERSIALRRYQLEAELAKLKEFVPRDQAELKAHIAKIEAAYGAFGTDLTKSGKQWASVVGTSLTNSMEVTRRKEANTASWAALGRVIAENMSKGAFNMTLSQFIKWISTGEMPKGAGVGYKGKNAHSVNGVWKYGTAGGITSGAHDGAIIGKNDTSRTGFTGPTSNSERLTRTLVGESVLNRRTTRNLGEDFIMDLNRWGGLPKGGYGIGGPNDSDMSLSAAMGTAPLAVAFRNAIGFMGDKKQMMLDAMASGAGSNAYPIDMAALYPGGWKRPAAGPRTSPYGMRFHPILKRWKLHGGSDIGAPKGAPVRSARGGRVTYAGVMGSYGNHIVVSHGGGLATTYSHLSSMGVKAGQNVTTGQGIGRVGSTGRSTGPHLHFEYMKNGKRLNPNLIIPGLDTGAFTMSDGLAQLHKGETVLTKPLTQDLHEGMDKWAAGPTTNVTVNATFTGNINGIDDLERGMIEVMERIEKRTGANRKVGKR